MLSQSFSIHDNYWPVIHCLGYLLASVFCQLDFSLFGCVINRLIFVRASLFDDMMMVLVERRRFCGSFTLSPSPLSSVNELDSDDEQKMYSFNHYHYQVYNPPFAGEEEEELSKGVFALSLLLLLT
jgi:hypothetical protein